MAGSSRSGQITINIIFILLCIICVAPLLLLVASSFTEESTLLQYGYNFIPRRFSIGAYTYLFSSGGKIFRACFITVIVTAVGTFLNVLLTLMFAYPLSRPELPYRNFFAFYVFFTMLFNGGLVPFYMMWTQTFHIKNTIFALIFPRLLMSAFYIIMMRSYFQNSIPNELIEAARMDGAGEFKILWGVVTPLSKPIIATVALMVGLNYWNDWMNSLYFVTDDKLFSIQAMLNTIMTNIQFLANNAASVGGGNVVLPSAGIRMAIAVIGVVPILCIYPFFQKYFVKGIVVGGVKG